MKRTLGVTLPLDGLPMPVVVRRIRALDWTYKRLHLLDAYVQLGVTEARDVLLAYNVCRSRYADIPALEALESAISELEAAV